jgi:hypothetical protein
MIPAKRRRPRMPTILSRATPMMAVAASERAAAVVAPCSKEGSRTRSVISPMT